MLRELAEAKKTVAISFDDLTWPTPAFAARRWAELTKAGIKERMSRSSAVLAHPR
jgi:hypothetical protein